LLLLLLIFGWFFWFVVFVCYQQISKAIQQNQGINVRTQRTMGGGQGGGLPQGTQIKRVYLGFPIQNLTVDLKQIIYVNQIDEYLLKQ